MLIGAIGLSTSRGKLGFDDVGFYHIYGSLCLQKSIYFVFLNKLSNATK